MDGRATKKKQFHPSHHAVERHNGAIQTNTTTLRCTQLYASTLYKTLVPFPAAAALTSVAAAAFLR